MVCSIIMPCIMNSEQFAFTRLAAQALDPLAWVWVLATAGVLLYLWRRTRPVGGLLAVLSLVWLGLLGWEPAAKLAFRTIENRYDLPTDIPKDVAGLIVMGGGAESDSVIHETPHAFSDYSIERLSHSRTLALAHPHWTVVFTGHYGKGTVHPAPRTEAQAALDYWKSKGLPPNPIEMEERSHNTRENAVNTAQLLGDRKKKTWVLVTSAWHMPRAVTAYRMAGVNVLPYPVDFRVRQPIDWKNHSIAKGREMWHTVITEHAARLALWWQMRGVDG
jgi:uncharacterized SAM-binding protein YcdF (DUF218 family)